MMTKCMYRKEGEQVLVVLYPLEAAPVVPQSCYVYGAPKRMEICRGINETAQRAFDVCKGSGMDDWVAADAVTELVDGLVCAMGYERTSTENVKEG